MIMTLRISNTYNYILGFMVILGGLMGYLKAHSKVSLIAGLSIGLLLLVIQFGLGRIGLIWQRVSYIIISIGLFALFVIRYMHTFSPMPAIPMIVLSFISIITNLYILHNRQHLQT